VIPRYTLPAMGAIWEETSKYRYWTQIEILAVEAWAALGVVPQNDLEAIKERARPVDPAPSSPHSGSRSVRRRDGCITG